MASPAHYLLTITRRPRVVAYLLAAAVMASPALAGPSPDNRFLLLALAVCAYPFCANAMLGRRFNHATGARLTMCFEGLMVGGMLGLVDFAPMPSLALATMLLVSTLIIAPPAWLLPVAGLLAASAAGVNFLAGLAQHRVDYESTAVAVASLAALGIYVSYLGYLVFEEMNARTRQRHSSESRLKAQESLRERLQTYVASGIATRGESIQRKCLTVFFSDIAGFTEMMESADENHAARTLNRYFDVMADIAGQFGGTVDKFIGDGMMVFFGDPDTCGAASDALRCVKMAEAMRDAARDIGLATGTDLSLRIGINTGHCLVGGFGSEKRRSYTALGSAVNLASRIEGVARPGEILVSEATAKLVEPSISLGFKGVRQLKGIQSPVRLYQVETVVPSRAVEPCQGEALAGESAPVNKPVLVNKSV